MKVFKLCLMTVFLTSYICAMEKYLQLSDVEKQLIVKNVKKRGKDKVLAEIHIEAKEQTSLVYDEPSGLVFFKKNRASFRNCMGFQIDEKFYQKDVNNDPLTKQIFDIVELSEKDKSFRPEVAWEAECEEFNNVLGTRTKYWWFKDTEDDSLSGINVKFRPHYYSGDQEVIKEVVQGVVDQSDQKAVEDLVNSVIEQIKEEKKCLQLSAIEKLLVLQQIEKRGKDNLLSEIRKERKYGSWQHDEEGQGRWREIPMALEIEEIFYKENIETDPLTKTIFTTIQDMENQNTHCPNCHVKKQNELCPECHVGINVDQWEVLGYRTSYEWIDDVQSNFSAIKMRCLFKANAYDQQGLEKCIADKG